MRKHKLYQDLGGEELRMEVVKLTNVDEILLKFSHLVEEVLIQQVETLNENQDGELVNSIEVGEAKSRQRKRLINVACIALKIIVRVINQIEKLNVCLNP